MATLLFSNKSKILKNAKKKYDVIILLFRKAKKFEDF